MSELGALVHAAIEAADGGEQVEAYAEEGRQTEVSALRERDRGHDLRRVARASASA